MGSSRKDSNIVTVPFVLFVNLKIDKFVRFFINKLWKNQP